MVRPSTLPDVGAVWACNCITEINARNSLGPQRFGYFCELAVAPSAATLELLNLRLQRKALRLQPGSKLHLIREFRWAQRHVCVRVSGSYRIVQTISIEL